MGGEINYQIIYDALSYVGTFRGIIYCLIYLKLHHFTALNTFAINCTNQKSDIIMMLLPSPRSFSPAPTELCRWLSLVRQIKQMRSMLPCSRFYGQDGGVVLVCGIFTRLFVLRRISPKFVILMELGGKAVGRELGSNPRNVE